MRVCVTGATGFVGKALVTELVMEHHHVVAAVRKQSTELPMKVEQKVIGDLSLLSESNTIIDTLDNVEVFVHTAARVHIMKDNAPDPLDEFRKINVGATIELARQAAKAGVRRFIFLSSIKVNGELTDNRQPFSESDQPAPEDDYGQSKLEAERALFELARATTMEIVIIRPPLIYGPGVKANFASLIKLINKGIPLPFGAIHNKRSMLAINNLVSFIKLCMTAPDAANQVFLIADGDDLSTTQLLNNIAQEYERPVRLIPVPLSLMVFCAKLIGKKSLTDRLFGNLQIDTSKAIQLLGWHAATNNKQQLSEMAKFDRQSGFKNP